MLIIEYQYSNFDNEKVAKYPLLIIYIIKLLLYILSTKECTHEWVCESGCDQRVGSGIPP